jgi:divalent metal cation (Fe/Co/Zn/Cd) transporter
LVGGSRTGSKKAVYAALAGNLGIAIAKLIAAIMTGSTAMLAETLHSFSDTFNQILLLVGIKTSTKTVLLVVYRSHNALWNIGYSFVGTRL